MKALSQALNIVVAVVVILVTALVILAVFFQGVTPIMGLTEARSVCQTEATISCSTFSQLPTTWNVQNRKVTRDGDTRTWSCSQILSEAGMTGCGCKGEEGKAFECTGSQTS